MKINNLEELETPCLILDKKILEKNCLRARQRCIQLNTILRPHIKTSKSIEIAKKIDARKTYFIHMTHNLEYESLRKILPEGVYVGYDGLKLQIN